MKNKIAKSDALKRASEVITSDRIGVSNGIEEVISKHISDLLSEFFSLSSQAKIKISLSKNGFDISITANAKSVKQLKILG